MKIISSDFIHNERSKALAARKLAAGAFLDNKHKAIPAINITLIIVLNLLPIYTFYNDGKPMVVYRPHQCRCRHILQAQANEI